MLPTTESRRRSFTPPALTPASWSGADGRALQNQIRMLGFTNPHAQTMARLLRQEPSYLDRSVVSFVIYSLLTERSVCVKDISATFDLSKPTTIRLCRRLEKKGLIERASDSNDRRRTVIRPSPTLQRKDAELWGTEAPAEPPGSDRG
jgi:DNA-binding MarR family transcriptional regulator